METYARFKRNYTITTTGVCFKKGKVYPARKEFFSFPHPHPSYIFRIYREDMQYTFGVDDTLFEVLSFSDLLDEVLK